MAKYPPPVFANVAYDKRNELLGSILVHRGYVGVPVCTKSRFYLGNLLVAEPTAVCVLLLLERNRPIVSESSGPIFSRYDKETNSILQDEP